MTSIRPIGALELLERAELTKVTGLSGEQLVHFELLLRDVLGWAKYRLAKDHKPHTMQEARRRLANIEHHAKGLMIALRAQPNAEYLIDSREALQQHGLSPFLVTEIGTAPENGPVTVDVMRGVLATFLGQLEVIATRAADTQLGDIRIRHLSDMNPRSDPRASAVTIELWPPLFELWEVAGKTVGYSENGTLERYLNLCHRLIEWRGDPPKSGTIRDAVKKWKRSPRRLGLHL